MKDTTLSTNEYELLTAKQKEQPGNVETATVQRVRVTETDVRLSLDFDWAADSTRLVYDLDDARDVRNLEAVTDEFGFEFAQVSYLEELQLTVRYTGEEWVPTAHTVSVSGIRSLLDIVVGRVRASVRRFVAWAHSLSMKQIIVGVILFKKMFVVAILIWLLV